MLREKTRSSSYDTHSLGKGPTRQQSTISPSNTAPGCTFRELNKERMEYRSRSRSKTRGRESQKANDGDVLTSRQATFDKYRELELQWNQLKTTLSNPSRATTPSSNRGINRLRDTNKPFSEDGKAKRKSSTASRDNTKTHQRFNSTNRNHNTLALLYTDLEGKRNSEALLQIAEKLKRDLDEECLASNAIPAERNSPMNRLGSSSGKLKYFGKSNALHKPSPGISTTTQKNVGNKREEVKSVAGKSQKKPIFLNINMDKDTHAGGINSGSKNLLIQTCKDKDKDRKTPANANRLAKTPISTSKNSSLMPRNSLKTKPQQLSSQFQLQQQPAKKKKQAVLNYPNTEKKYRAFVESPTHSAVKSFRDSAGVRQTKKSTMPVSVPKSVVVNKQAPHYSQHPERHRLALKKGAL